MHLSVPRMGIPHCPLRVLPVAWNPSPHHRVKLGYLPTCPHVTPRCHPTMWCRDPCFASTAPVVERFAPHPLPSNLSLGLWGRFQFGGITGLQSPSLQCAHAHMREHMCTHTLQACTPTCAKSRTTGSRLSHFKCTRDYQILSEWLHQLKPQQRGKLCFSPKAWPIHLVL